MTPMTVSRSATVKERIVEYLGRHPDGASDTELEFELRESHQYINQVCRRLADQGRIERVQGGRTIVNRLPVRSGGNNVPSSNRMPICEAVSVKSPSTSEMPSDAGEFESAARRYFSRLWGVALLPRSVLVAGSVPKKFDLVSVDGRFVGDAKWYKNIPVPAAKYSTIAEYVWLLQLLTAERRFMVFGRDVDVPIRWLERFGPLTCPLEFYFFDGSMHRQLWPPAPSE